MRPVDPYEPEPARLKEGECERCKCWVVINPEYGVCEECFDPEKDVRPGGPKFQFECGSTESRRARTRRDGTGRVNPAVGFLDGAKVRNADTADCTDSSQPSDWPALNSLPVRRFILQALLSRGTSLDRRTQRVNGDCAPVRPAVVLSDATASICPVPALDESRPLKRYQLREDRNTGSRAYEVMGGVHSTQGVETPSAGQLITHRARCRRSTIARMRLQLVHPAILQPGITAPRQSANRPAIEKRKAAGMLSMHSTRQLASLCRRGQPQLKPCRKPTRR